MTKAIARTTEGIRDTLFDEIEDLRVDQTSAARAGVNPVDEPLRTTTTSGSHAVVVPSIANITHTGTPRVEPIDEPLRTVTGAHRGEKALVGASLVQMGYGEREGQAPRALDPEKPLGTVVAGGNKAALVAAFLAKHYGGHETPGWPLPHPISTATAQDHHGLVAAHIVKNNFGDKPHSAADDPLHTVTTQGNRFGLAAAHLLNLKGADRRSRKIDAPAPSQQASGTHAAVVAAFLDKYYGTGVAAPVDEPMPSSTTKARASLVTVEIDGEPWAVVDIGMRMLTPRELFRAQGFPNSYTIDPIYNGKPMTKTAQIRMCGNSVCPPLSAALVRANLVDEAMEAETA